jgi:hypothetical protein
MLGKAGLSPAVGDLHGNRIGWLPRIRDSGGP